MKIIHSGLTKDQIGEKPELDKKVHLEIEFCTVCGVLHRAKQWGYEFMKPHLHYACKGMPMYMYYSIDAEKLHPTVQSIINSDLYVRLENAICLEHLGATFVIASNYDPKKEHSTNAINVGGMLHVSLDEVLAMTKFKGTLEQLTKYAHRVWLSCLTAKWRSEHLEKFRSFKS